VSSSDIFSNRIYFSAYPSIARHKCSISGPRLSALAKCPSLLSGISHIEVGIPRSLFVIPRSFKPPVLNRLIISAFLRNAPQMRKLHTARFSEVKVNQEHLALLLQSNNLQHLILFQCGLPRSVRLPPSHIRYLTLWLRDDCNHMHTEPLLRHCSANLEALHIAVHLWQAPLFTTLPQFPKLRKLRFTMVSGSPRYLTILTSLAPNLEHLEVWVQGCEIFGLPTLPTSLNHLRTDQRLIGGGSFGTRPFVHLRHLHIANYVHAAGDNHGSSFIPIIQCIFPNVTSLHVEIHHSSRNIILLLARALPNVTRLKLSIDKFSLSLHDSGDATPSITGTPGGPLASLYAQVLDSQKRDMDFYKSWIIHTVLGHTVGLGGPHLQEVVVSSTTGTGTPLHLWCWKQVKKEWVFFSDTKTSERIDVPQWLSS
jgi:hypothetical protein